MPPTWLLAKLVGIVGSRRYIARGFGHGWRATALSSLSGNDFKTKGGITSAAPDLASLGGYGRDLLEMALK